MKILSIINSAYRGTIEEQDDTVIWLSRMLRQSGADLDVVLAGNAVNYAVKRQDASGLSFGDKVQKEPPNLVRELGGLRAQGSKVYVVRDDVAARGLESTDLIAGLTPVARADLAGLVERYDQLWNW